MPYFPHSTTSIPRFFLSFCKHQPHQLRSASQGPHQLTLSFLSFFSCRLSLLSSFVLPFESSFSSFSLLLFFRLSLLSLESSLSDPELDEAERDLLRLSLSRSRERDLSRRTGDFDRERSRPLPLPSVSRSSG